MTLSQFKAHFKGIYGVNNSVYFTCRSECLHVLMVFVRKLEDKVRKQALRGELVSAIANAFSWTMALANTLEFDLSAVMAKKYPATCGYCGEKPCNPVKCSDANRPTHSFLVVEPGQESWTLDEWQHHLKQLYGDVNKERGVEHALLKLFSELGEFAGILAGACVGYKAEQILEEYTLEIADIIARLIAVANLLDIPIQQVVMKMYGDGCPVCGDDHPETLECECPQFAFRRNELIRVKTVSSEDMRPNPGDNQA